MNIDASNAGPCAYREVEPPPLTPIPVPLLPTMTTLTDQNPAGYSQHDNEEVHCLLLRIAQEDPEAFKMLHTKLHGLVFGIAFQVLHHREDTEDVVQEVFAQLWKKAALYTNERGKPTSWLITLTRNRAIDKFRSRNRRSRLNDDFLHEPVIAKAWIAPSPAIVVQAQETAQETRSALLHLTPEQRQAIQMAFFDDLTQSEIAARTGAPIGTVKARIRRGLGKLRDVIKA